MKKKLLLKILLFLIFIFFAYLLTVFYFVTDGFRDYKGYCSQFIPALEFYYEQHQRYPKNILELAGGKTGFNFRYNPDECGYKPVEKGYIFYLSDGYLGIWGYESWTNKWWYD